MTIDHIAQLDIKGFKSIEDLSLQLDGLTVLIGENGSGKSSILDALLLLGSAAERRNHIPDILEARFGRFEKFLHRGSAQLRLEAIVRGAAEDLYYGFSIGSAGAHAVVQDEWLFRGRPPMARGDGGKVIRVGSDLVFPREAEGCLLSRSAELCSFRRDDGTWGEHAVPEQALGAPFIGAAGSAPLARLLQALERIDVHPPFDVRPIWQQKELKTSEGPRWPSSIEPAANLKRFGVNLASAFHELRTRGGDAWERALNLARLGFGGDLRDIRVPATTRGYIELELIFGSAPHQPMAAEVLSEGQISYLCFIALCELRSRRSILAIDEPEIHLHPALLARVVAMLEEVAEDYPVMIATHSDRLLDALDSPEHMAVLCELNENRATQLRRPSEQALRTWIEMYGGLGTIRAHGYESLVFATEETETETAGTK